MENQKVTICTLLLVVCVALAGYFVYPQATNAINLYQEVQSKTQTVENLKNQIQDMKRKKEAKLTTKPCQISRVLLYKELYGNNCSTIYTRW